MTKHSKDYLEYGVTPKLFHEWRSPRFGTENPTRMTNPVWEWLIRTKYCAYTAAEMFDCTSSSEISPTWCFDRFGQSCTTLLDGRKVYIAGEHEDYYDPDFYIYNDIVVENTDGSIRVFCYPRDTFPPTDFHSATIVDSEIIVIGNLGYPEDRKYGKTQVLSIDTNTFSVSLRPTSGNQPGWIHAHQATLSKDGQSILVSGGKIERQDARLHIENIDDWSLNLESGVWERLVHRHWPRWQIYRADRQGNHLWYIREALWNYQAGWSKDYTRSMSELDEALGRKPDIFSVDKLYRPNIEHKVLPERDEEYAVYRIQVDDVTIRYVEEHYGVHVTVEGDLPENILRELVEDVKNKISELENTQCVAEEIA